MATYFDGFAATWPGDPTEFADYAQYVLGSYFETMAIPVLQGRRFEAADAASSGRVVVVN